VIGHQSGPATLDDGGEARVPTAPHIFAGRGWRHGLHLGGSPHARGLGPLFSLGPDRKLASVWHHDQLQAGHRLDLLHLISSPDFLHSVDAALNASSSTSTPSISEIDNDCVAPYDLLGETYDDRATPGIVAFLEFDARKCIRRH